MTPVSGVPLLLTEVGTDTAIALDAVTLVRAAADLYTA